MTLNDEKLRVKQDGKDSDWIQTSEFDTIPAVLPAKQLRDSTIETLDLSNKGLGEDGGLILAALMAGNSSTQYLQVSKNALRAAGAKAISEMLKVNKTLTKVDLSDNEIGAYFDDDEYD